MEVYIIARLLTRETKPIDVLSSALRPALLALALRAIDRGSSGDNHLAQRRLADLAQLAGAAVDHVLQLEEAANSVRIDVVRDRRSAQLDCLSEDLL